MNQEIRYLGMSVTPSDYDCQDGELALSLNLINEDSAITPIAYPAESLVLDDDKQSVLFIHKTTSFTHYICRDTQTDRLYWRDNSTSGELATISDISHCNAIGNTLIIFAKYDTHYFLWKNKSYIPLGRHIPDIQLSFGLVGHPRLFSKSDASKKPFNISFVEMIEEDNIRADFSETNRNSITAQIMAKVNKFIADQTINKGRFCFPFFVRYALRMYDGTLTSHSNPILMNPQTLPAPVVMWNRLKGKGKYSEAECDIMLMACDIDYQAIAGPELDNLDNWSDLITSVDVFISKPLYTYDQNGTINNLVDTDNFDTTFIGRITHDKYDVGGLPLFSSYVTEDRILAPIDFDRQYDFLKCYAEWPYNRIYQLYFDRSYPGETFHLPEFTEEKRSESVRNCAQFYLLHSIPLPDLKSNPSQRTVIAVGNDYLQSLVTRELMSDDYLSRDTIVASQSQVYNSRLNISGVKRKPFPGFSPLSMFAFTDKYIYTWHIVKETGLIKVASSPAQDNVSIDIILQEDDRVRLLQTSGNIGAYLSPALPINSVLTPQKVSTGCFIFYPNVKATYAVIHSSHAYNPESGIAGSMIVKLKPHEFLNGAYALLDYNQLRLPSNDQDEIPVAVSYPYGEDAFINCANKVFTSEVNNPFFFPVTGINTIGTGKILGIATAAKALSQGQFGQFPLYAFTDEGVWAMEVSATGSFSAKQPITRDVCINPDGITQIDSAVLFPTRRGIILISGSQTISISDNIINTSILDFDSLKGFCSLHPSSSLSIVPFLKFISHGGMLYDYSHQRIIVFNPEYSYAYVYSLKSKLWGLMNSDILHGLNSYPEAMAVSQDGRLLNFSIDADSFMPGLLITRPLKLGAPDILKTIDTVIQRGSFRRGDIQSILYGSRDLINWHIVWSSRDHFLRGFSGSPYKYFKIVLLSNLKQRNALSGASVSLSPKQTNRLR